LISYAKTLKNSNELNDQELDHLGDYLRGCLDKKRLQKTAEVNYNKEEGFIESINGLTFDKKRRKFTLKKSEKRVSTLKSLPPKKKPGRPKSAKTNAKTKKKTPKKEPTGGKGPTGGKSKNKDKKE